MEAIWVELGVVFLLILANGFFAGAELALITVRPGRLAKLAAAGDQRAKAVEQLVADPHRFLATVQIGITLVGSMASAVGGVAAVEVIKPLLKQAPVAFVRQAAEPLALFLVVGLIAYCSLILGELVPKALALEYSERIALAVARPIRLMARVGGLAVLTLTVSSQGVLALLGIRGKGKSAFLTQEDIRQMVAEGRETGAVSPREQELIGNVFDFSRIKARQVMVPRTRTVALDLMSSRENILQVVLQKQYSRYPVYRESLENIVGFIHAKDLLGQVLKGLRWELEALTRPAFFVPESKKIDELLREMQHRHAQMAMVVDEYGGFSGIVTTEDLLEELVGEIEDEHDRGASQRIKRLKEGSLLVDGLLPVNDLADLLGVRFPEGKSYETLAGLILFELGHLPEEGEQLHYGAYLLTCSKVTQSAILRVKIEPLEQEGGLADER